MRPRTFQIDTQTIDATEDTDCDFLKMIEENQRLSRELAKEISLQHQLKTKEYFDRNKHDHRIKQGSHVYLYRPIKGEELEQKFSPHYVGPYVCTEVLENNTVHIKDLKTQEQYLFMLHDLN